MNENLNLCEILKDCPKGTKFYSPFLGDCEFVEVGDDYVKIRNACLNYSINANGTFPFGAFDSAEIMLVPSREQRSWSKWVCPKKPKFNPKTFNPFDKVLGRHKQSKRWFNDFYSFSDEDDIATIGNGYFDAVIPYNDETKHLLGTSDEAPEFYRYWED